MAFEQRELSGSLFRNDRKEQPQQPDYRGTCLIDGVNYKISAWIKQGKDAKDLQARTATPGPRGYPDGPTAL